jgi:hypothetical protein
MRGFGGGTAAGGDGEVGGKDGHAGAERGRRPDQGGAEAYRRAKETDGVADVPVAAGIREARDRLWLWIRFQPQFELVPTLRCRWPDKLVL